MLKRVCVLVLFLTPLAALAENPPSDYQARLAKLAASKEPKAWLALADFCEEHLLWKEREEALRKTLEFDPESAQAHGRLDEAKWEGSWIPVDQAETKEAEAMKAKGLAFYATKWIEPAEADLLRKKDRASVGWDMEVRVDTPRLRLYSDRGICETRRLAAILDNFICAYRRVYAKPFSLKPSAVLKVYCFETSETYVDTFKNSTGKPMRENSGGGIYSRETGTLYVGKPPGPITELLRQQIAVRCCIHALDDLAGVDIENHAWFTNGRVMYWQYAIVGRQVLPGAARVDAHDKHPDTLEKIYKDPDLKALLRLDKDGFSQNPSRNQAESWGLVHFLSHGQGGKYAEGFLRFAQQIQKNPSKAKLEECLSVKVADLREAVQTHVQKVLLPAATGTGLPVLP